MLRSEGRHWRWLGVAVACIGAIALAIVLSTALRAENASATIKEFKCLVQDVAVFPNERVHVRCGDRALREFMYFALSIQDPSVSLVLGMLRDLLSDPNASRSRTISVLYESDAAANPLGCLARDCRKLTGIVISPPSPSR